MDIVYGVPCQHPATATWVANTVCSTFGGEVAVTLTPGTNGRFAVYLDGEKLVDRKAEGNAMPDLGRMRQRKQVM